MKMKVSRPNLKTYLSPISPLSTSIVTLFTQKLMGNFLESVEMRGFDPLDGSCHDSDGVSTSMFRRFDASRCFTSSPEARTISGLQDELTNLSQLSRLKAW